MTTSVKCKTLFFLKVDLCKNLSKGKPIHFAEKYESKWHLGRGVFYHCTSQRHRNSRVPLALIQFITSLIPEKKIETPQFFFSQQPHWQTRPNQEIIWAILRLLRVTPYCPWGKCIGNPSADIQSVRKSSWLCLQNTPRVPTLSITSSASTPGHCLLSEDFTSFLIGPFVPCPLPTHPSSQFSTQ